MLVWRVNWRGVMGFGCIIKRTIGKVAWEVKWADGGGALVLLSLFLCCWNTSTAFDSFGFLYWLVSLTQMLFVRVRSLFIIKSFPSSFFGHLVCQRVVISVHLHGKWPIGSEQMRRGQWDILWLSLSAQYMCPMCMTIWTIYPVGPIFWLVIDQRWSGSSTHEWKALPFFFHLSFQRTLRPEKLQQMKLPKNNETIINFALCKIIIIIIQLGQVRQAQLEPMYRWNPN